MTLPSKQELLEEAYEVLTAIRNSGNEYVDAHSRRAGILVAIAHELPSEKAAKDRPYGDAAQL